MAVQWRIRQMRETRVTGDAFPRLWPTAITSALQSVQTALGEPIVTRPQRRSMH